ncbi:mRNA interferase MazF [Sulfurivirga caldicuralii]|uniref:mRNA interferase MazF n=1 Tax=Sulfurivirga caldicuralii TaxID=364032 RepID=A0A1N6FDU6_9GAMM|nr:type II toxin-antitoxin system PemK/MazF family toxin [Sulfurivirga caldicuralii]SIN93432.1 mRNA interferase MazF [Sulfurivirga caldicuralii]
MPCEKGDIVLTPFPFSDLATMKKWPVLLLTPQDRHGDVIAMAITSQVQNINAYPIDESDLAEGKLPKQRHLRTDKLFTLSASLIIKKIATLKPDIHRRVIQQTCHLLDNET